MLSFGLVGIFIGPVVLAVTYTLADASVATPDGGGTGTAAASRE